MKRLFLFGYFALSLLSQIFALSKKELTSALKASEGYYYCEADNSVIKVSLKEKALRVEKCSFDFTKEKIYSISFTQEKFESFDDDKFQSFTSDISVENNKISSIKHNGFVYGFYSSQESEMVGKLKQTVIKSFANACAVYFDESIRTKFTLFNADNQLKLNVSKKGCFDNTFDLEIDNSNNASCNEWSVNLKNGEIRFGENKKSAYISVFKTVSKKCISKSPDKKAKANVTTSLNKSFSSEYDFLYDVDGYYDTSDYSYDLYLDDDGWKKLNYKDKSYMIIDNSPGYDLMAFEFKGESFAKDKEAVKKYIKEYPADWYFINVGGQKNLNGLYFENIKASSTLKDKSHTYAIEGTLTAYNPRTFDWVKDSLPWAEGKSGDGIGETIELDVKFGAAHNNNYFSFFILNGYVDPLRPYLFKQNNRIKKARIETDSGYNQIIDFNDWVEFKEIKFGEAPVRHIKITILEVYKGTKYSDTCVTAFDLYDGWWNK